MNPSISSPSKFEPKKAAEPVWFVDPMTGEFLEFDLKTATFKKEPKP